MKPNPTLLKLLKLGAKIEFPDHTSLIGDPANAYINIAINGDNQGVWSLDKSGLSEAMVDRNRLVADARGDDFSDIAKPGYGMLILTKQGCVDDKIGPKKKLKAYNIVSEGGDWLEGADDRIQVRKRYKKRYKQSMKVPHEAD